VSFRESTQENKMEEILKECSVEDVLLLWRRSEVSLGGGVIEGVDEGSLCEGGEARLADSGVARKFVGCEHPLLGIKSRRYA